MSKFLRSLSAWLLVCFAPVMAQQLPDPHFEDWSGAQFDGNIQPKHWNFSNVSQMGVDRNFAHQGTGRSGKCLKIQDQWVGAMGIGATSPGYVALGHPWAYVSSLTTIEDATAGTYGGISWQYRPDSMVVWIKRYHDSSVDNNPGDHISQENFNLLYYAWSGTSQGESYKAKNLTCTNLSSAAPQYCVDEESDIRLALNGNECGTPKVQAKQIAEGWFYQKKAYGSWTRIAVPIYYLNDDKPTKCNVILSAGNYPNFRANSGQYAGSTLDVDDIELIYTSKAQKVYIGGREWKGFDPNNTGEQVYSLGTTATSIPEISVVRGAGSLTNNRGGKATFPGRRLGSNECTVVYGQIDGAATTITIKAEDNSSTTTYRIKFVTQASNNARLADIKVNGETISGFNAYLPTYNVALPYGTTAVPVVSATAQDAGASIKITQPTSVNGTATIVVTAADGTTKQTYTLAFSVAALTDVTLKNIFVDGAPLSGFQPSKSNYTVSLPLGTTRVPTITWESAYSTGAQQIQLLSNTLESGAQIKVSIPNNNTLSKTYKLNYKIEASSYSLLAGIALDGVPLEGFSPENTVYSVTLPMGTTTLPQITWTAGDSYQTVRLTEGGVDGTTRIEVTAASGAVTTYRIVFRTEKSTINALAGIAVDGEPLEAFDADTLEYHLSLPAGTTTLPTVTWTAGDPYQTVKSTPNTALMTVLLTVTAGDGSQRKYTLYFEVQKSEAYLQMIYLGNAELEGFDSQKWDYSLIWTADTMPKISVLAEQGQTITIAAPSSYGTARIVVTPEEGTPNVYTICFRSPDQPDIPSFPEDLFPASTDASLKGLYINGHAYEPFHPDLFDYIDSLPRRTMQTPSVVPVAATSGQTISVAEGGVDRVTTIHVVAADGVTTQDYRIAFPTKKSSNTALLSVEIEGAEINFDPAQYAYTDIELPYGTTVSPVITVERAEPEQSLTIIEAPIGETSSVVVTAEDGTRATYTFTYRVALPSMPNELVAIVLDGFDALDMTQGPDFVIDLPYGTQDLTVASVAKSYPEQQVTILSGGVTDTTFITVKSLNPDEADAVYTITPNVYPLDPAQLLDIQVNGESMTKFRPGMYNYLLSSPDTVPVVTFTKQDGDTIDVDVDGNDKWVKLTVTAGEDSAYIHTYLVTFFYPNDIYFDMDFENWSDYSNDNTNSSGKVPNGWYAPINAVTSGDAGTYYPEKATQFVTDKTHGSKAAELATTYLTTSAESMPGFLSLSQPTVSVGKWLLGVYEIHSSLAFGDPIPFRNTPDNVAIDYKLFEYKNKANGWKFVYNANGMQQINLAQNFSSLTKEKWYTYSQPISYDPDFVPVTLEILICAAPSTVLETYYTNFGASRSTSRMNVDNLRFSYNSVLNGLSVNGNPASLSDKAFAVTIDAESKDVPALAFDHAVPDQMPVVSWSEEVEGVRTATIRNYAENLSFTDYTLTVTRPKSANTSCMFALEGRDLMVTKGSHYQTVAITENDTAFVITVTAETGDEAVYYAAWGKAVANPSRIKEEAADTIPGESTAHLLNLTNDPVLHFEREYPLDSVSISMTAQAYELHVFGATKDTIYVIDRNASDNALLDSIKANDQFVPNFDGETYDYFITLSSLDSIKPFAADTAADVQYTIVPIDDAYAAVYVQVTAPNGVTQRRYTVLANIRTFNSEADLLQILADDVLLDGFRSDSTDYIIGPLPAHSAIPELSTIASAGATVESLTETNGSSAKVTFTVTSEDQQNTKIYTVDVQVIPSEICTLKDIIIDGLSIDDFDPDMLRYMIELPSLPSDASGLSDIIPIPTDGKLSKVDTTVYCMTDTITVTITVTAENGQTKGYTIVFTKAKSTNADLKSISLDGEPLASFFVDEHAYTVTLPYGAPLPVITAETADPAATWVVNGTTITVTAEDGITTATYTLNFTYLPSENAELQAIYLDNVLQNGFRPDSFEYRDTVLYGGTMPVITWKTGDDQQTVDTAWVGDTQLTIVVTAGDEMTISEYTLYFEHLLSSNSALADLRVNGTTIDGFHPDTIAYKIIYPVGSSEADLINETNVTAIPADPGATVTISMDGTTVLILVTAPDGSRSVYVIEQEILVSHEARLKMIWLDDTLQVRGFIPDTLHYTIVLAPGANMPTLTAETLDPRGTWDLGMPEEQEDSSMVISIFSTAEDSVTTLTYTLTFRYANWTASATVDTDDYLFFPIGSGQFKAVTIGIGVQLGIYDLNGHLFLIDDVPTADPSDVEVAVDQQGNQKLVSASPNADGLVYTAPEGQLMFYVFFDSKTKKIAKGGKFGWNR